MTHGEVKATSPAGRRIVAYLLSQTGPVKAADIAKALGLAPTTVKNDVAYLIKHGYVHRAVLVTDKGRALLAQSS